MRRNPKQPEANASIEGQEQAMSAETWLNHVQAEAGAMGLSKEQFQNTFVLSVVHLLLYGTAAPRDELVDDQARLVYLKRIMSEEASEADIELLFATYCEHRDSGGLPPVEHSAARN